MKKFNLLSVIVIVLSFLFSTVAMTSCSSYDDEEYLFKQVNDNNGGDDNNGDDNNNGGDENEDGLASATLLQKTFGLEDGKWISKLTFEVVDYEGNHRDTTYTQELPFFYTLGEEEFKSTEDVKASAFIALGDADTNSTEFVKNDLSNYVKKVTRTQLVSFSKFDRVLTSYHHEAYRFVAGKRYDFVSSVENASYGSLSQTVSEIENEEGKKFERESNLVSMKLTFNKNNFETQAITNVDRELKSNNDNNDNNGNNEGNNDENKDDEVNADITIDGLQKFLGWTKVYDNNRFHDCLLFETNNSYVAVIDGKLENKNIINKSTVAASSKYTSAVYNNGSYLPAVITVNGTGWTYCGEFANGNVLTQTMSDQLAITKDIKNFSETNSAKPSPIVKNHNEVKSVNGKVVITVYGYTVDGKLNKAYTVAGK